MASKTSPATSTGSRVLRGEPGCRWQGVPVVSYRQTTGQPTWCGISRQDLVGASGEATAFELHYFEIEPAGYSSLESHVHEHAVYVLRGRGRVQLGQQFHDLGPGDVVYVAPREVHQFKNASADEPFGFLCAVDRERDAPVPVQV